MCHSGKCQFESYWGDCTLPLGQEQCPESEEPPADDFATAFKFALEQGYIKFDVTNFRGWQNNCGCDACRSQEIIYDYLFGSKTDVRRAYPATCGALGRWKERINQK